MNQNSLVNIESTCNASLLPGSVFSSFNIEDVTSIIKSNFSKFVNSRILYLERLKSLDDNWISGNSKKPRIENIDIAKEMLIDLRDWYKFSTGNAFCEPKIVMSPTPEGGIYLELELSKEVKTWIKIFEDSIELEVEKCGFFEDKETNRADVFKHILDLYKTNELLSNSKRRDSFQIYQSTSPTT